MPALPLEWRPILDDRAAASALALALAIAETVPSSASSHLNRDASLADGAAGVGVFLSYAARACPPGARADHFRALAGQYIDAACESASEMEDSSLYGGLAGVGWALEHVRRTSSDDAVEASDDLDELLLELLGEGAWSSTYDLIGGLVGLGVYALERDGTEPSTRILSLVLDRLSETCERSEIGATWFTRPAWLSPRQRELDPEGHHNLGVSHGIAGIVGLLGHLCDSDAHRSRARALLDEAMRWLLAQQRDFDRARFPILLSPTRTLGPGRLSWCYGDLGIGVTLLDVARRAQRPTWGAVASSLVVNAAARGTAAVNDAGLCHGAFGNAHLFARAYHATSDESLAAAARAWLQIGLDLHGRGTESSYGLLTGVSGIGLALLAASTPLEPAWDRFLLAS